MKSASTWILIYASFLVFPFKSSAVEKVLFLGISGDGSPAIEQTFDRLVRERLSVIPDLALVDYIETLRYRKQIGMDNNPVVSEKLLFNIYSKSPDTVLIVWGIIKETSVESVRSRLIYSLLEARLTVGLSIYIPADERFAYTGNIESVIRKRKGLVLFSSIKDDPPAGGAERSAIIDELLDDAAAKSASLVSSIVRNMRMRTASIIKQDSTDSSTPSISDVFTVPSVKPPLITDQSKIEDSDSLKSQGRKLKNDGKKK